MAYKYDVFLSYNRKFPHGKWVKEVFLPLFEDYLREALNKKVKIFIDTEEIESGQAWKLKIENALIHSRIMVSVVSAEYFLSEWCVREFAVMDYRQRQSGYLTFENPNGLIALLKIFDGEHFSDYVNSLQITDFRDFSRVGIDSVPTLRYIDFQDDLLTWVNKSVAHAYQNAPEWKEEWKHPDWVTNAMEDIDKFKGLPNNREPKL